MNSALLKGDMIIETFLVKIKINCYQGTLASRAIILNRITLIAFKK